MRIAHPKRHFVSATASVAQPFIFSTKSFSSKRKSLSLSPSLYPLYPPTLTLSPVSASSKMSDSLENCSSLSTVSAVDDAKFGFSRPEMYSSKLSDSVDPYDRHLFLCYKTPQSWPSKVEGSDSDPLPKLFASALKNFKDDIPVKTKLTVFEGGEGSGFSDGDVLIFPEMIKYRELKESDVNAFVEDVLVKGQAYGSGVMEVMCGSHVFVCVHGSRDKRCGVCGPVLIEKLKQEIEQRDLNDQIFVSGCSHVGGHKYAGNAIIFSPDSEGKVSGHWYGYVKPEDVPSLLDQHIGKGEVIERLWRGQMGVPKDAGKKHKQPNGTVSEITEKKSQESENQSTKENFTSCCQGANGVSCCRDASTDEKPKSAEKSAKKGQGERLCWPKTWEQSDVLAAAAVVGAVATILVAYSIYRRSH
ncbi:Thioredoxin-like ferredoxin [Dillenia turbinata]|uniref:Thioredoxin-like ferredoxin n=1 Tax=Dillenia turbinata TaxID=194707 RepID=A0AAN8VEH2_9MAGN